MIVQITLASLLLGDGLTLNMYEDAGGCEYGHQKALVINNANLTIAELCWRLNSSTGRIMFDGMEDRPVEEFNWTHNGVVWIRKVIR